MNILIIGDSWGVPNYPHENVKRYDNWLPEHHIEYRLRNLGYDVYNYSLNGNSNKRTMESVDFSIRHEGVDRTLVPKSYLPSWMCPVGHPKSLPRYIDWTIWFHTEVFRDGFDKKKTFQENLIEKSHEVYSFAKEFFTNVGGKIAVIGGQAPIGPSVKDIFYNYITPDYIIEDWRSLILGKKLPECYTVSSINGSLSWALQGIDNWEEKEKIIDIQEIVLNEMRNSRLFPDDAHPGAEPHEKLTNKLHEVFQGYNEII